MFKLHATCVHTSTLLSQIGPWRAQAMHLMTPEAIVNYPGSCRGFSEEVTFGSKRCASGVGVGGTFHERVGLIHGDVVVSFFCRFIPKRREVRGGNTQLRSSTRRAGHGLRGICAALSPAGPLQVRRTRPPPSPKSRTRTSLGK